MYNIQQLISLGKIKILKTGEYDNSVKDELGQYEIIRAVKEYNQYVFHDETLQSYVYFNPQETITSINCYGRPCILLEGYAEINGRGRLWYIGGHTLLYGLNDVHDPIQLSNWYGWHVGDNGVSYTYAGDEEWFIRDLNDVASGVLFDNSEILFDDTGRTVVNCTLSINLPVFLTIDDVNEYLRTGDASNSVNVPDIENVENDLYYYIYNQSNINKLNNSVSSSQTPQNKYFKIADTESIAFVKKVNTENEYVLESTAATVYIYDETTEDYTQEIPFADIYIEVIDGYKNVSGANYIQGTLETNIQKVNSLTEAVPNYNGTTLDSFNGIDNPMELTSISASTSFIKPYLLTDSEVDDVASILFHNDENFIDSLKKGLWMYNENPINAIIDLCYYPIDLSVYIDSTRTFRLKFGSFAYSGEVETVPRTAWNLIRSTHKTFTLINKKINAIYNDFRDITTVCYLLFLPFYGLINLDNIVVNRTLKVDSKFDMYTGQLKYYIFIDSSLYSCVECSIGRHISVLGTDWINKSTKNIEAGASILTNAGALAVNTYTENVGGALSNVSNILNAYRGYEEKPNVHIAGSRTSGLNIYDPLSCFLIVEQYETIKPSNLNSEYGKPTYYISTINKCSGYTEIADIKLITRALNSEIDEINTLLKNGVVI